MPLTLLQRIAAGDTSAVAACLDEYGGTIWGLAKRYLEPVGGDAEDAVQEIFVQVWREAHRFDPSRGSEPAFIATIAHRRLTDRRRRMAARPAVALGEHDPAHRPMRADPALVGDDLSAARSALERLSEEERDVLWMAFHMGMTHERIAEQTRTPVGTVKTRIRRGLMRLREMLGDGAGAVASLAPSASGRATKEVAS